VNSNRGVLTVNATTTEGMLGFSSAVGFASLILYVLTIDRLIRTLREHYREDWIALSRPVGIFYIPENTSWGQGMVAQLELVCDVLFKTPAWLAGKSELLFLIKKIRWCIALVVLSLLIGLVLG
jgi:hypothetical protein